MVVDLNRTIALRCPKCGRLELSNLSLFSASRKVVVKCSCGFTKMTLSRRGRHYLVQVACIICEVNHTLSFEAGQFLHRDCIPIYCMDNEVELGHFGVKDAVEKVVSEDALSLENLVSKAGRDFFYRADIMQGILSVVQSLAETGRVRCECGNEALTVTLHPDRAEVICDICGNSLEIMAETDEDLEVVRMMAELSLERGLATLDGTHLFADKNG